MLLAISNEGKIGLGLLAGLLIAFAILSAFYFPRRDPDFPGNRLGLFIFVSVVLFVGTIVGVFVFAAEEEAEHGAEVTETNGTRTGEPLQVEPEGDAEAGEAVFESAGCGSCHVLEAAGSSGEVGPNLDEAKPDIDRVLDRVTNGSGVMPSFKGQLNGKQIQDVARFVVDST